MNGAWRELVAVGGVLWVKDGHCLGVGHTLGYAWHILPSMLPTTSTQGYDTVFGMPDIARHILACYHSLT